MSDTLPAPPPSEVDTSPHHEIPPRLSSADEMRLILGQVLDAKLKEHLEPLHGIRQVVDQLRGSLDLAVLEMRRQNIARKGEIREHDGRLDAHDTRLDGHDGEIAELRKALAEERGRIDALEREIDRWALAGGPMS